MFRRNKSPKLSRQHAMNAKPIKVPSILEEYKDDKLQVTVEYQRPHWQRMLGASESCRRTFGLDTYGQEVYASCNGKRSVNEIIRRFAKNHSISKHEAETAVTTFMKTMMSRGLIGMVMK